MVKNSEAEEIKREYLRSWRAKNKEHIRKYAKEWREKNKEKLKQYEEKHWSKKALEKNKEEY